MFDGIIERYLCLRVCRVHDRSSNVPRRVMILSEIAQYAVNYSVGYKVRHPVYMRAKTVVGGRTIDVGFFHRRQELVVRFQLFGEIQCNSASHWLTPSRRARLSLLVLVDA